jgi:hypothetical protein
VIVLHSITSASLLGMMSFSTFTAILTDGLVRRKISQKNAKNRFRSQEIIYFQDITWLWFCGNIFKLNDLCLPPWHDIFSTFAAIIAKHDCAIQFILTVKLEKMIVKSKQNSQHHSTHSGCSKTLIWRLAQIFQP